jgi:hypothetical protein
MTVGIPEVCRRELAEEDLVGWDREIGAVIAAGAAGEAVRTAIAIDPAAKPGVDCSVC